MSSSVRIKKKPFVIIGLLIAGAAAFYWLQTSGFLKERITKRSEVPQAAELPQFNQTTTTTTGFTPSPAPGSRPARGLEGPTMVIDGWAWSSQMGLWYAMGGKTPMDGSIMAKHKVNVRWQRQDDVSQMQNDLVTCAQELANGARECTDGVTHVSIMWDGAPAFLAGVNTHLAKLGPDYIAENVGSLGYSRGEDKLMGLPEWKTDPQSARGGLIAGVLKDGDWNIAQKWAGDNGIPNNPDDRTWDPDGINWVNAPTYLEAGEMYIKGYCEDRPVVRKGVKTGESKHVCVKGVVTWTPGDVNVARKKGGLVSIVSTREYSSQMPNAIIGIKRFNRENKTLIENFLAAAFEGADNIKFNSQALAIAAKVSADVYREEDAGYWEKYFKVVRERDVTGLEVELGGSSVNNLADNLALFGLAPGSTNVAAAVYETFGNILVQQYPKDVPNYPAVSQVLNTSYVQGVASRFRATTPADVPQFSGSTRIQDVVSERSWSINFRTGSADFTPDAEGQLRKLANDLMIAGSLAIEIHGHTDAVGDDEANMALSERRAFAVKRWLQDFSAGNFPDNRIRVRAFGETQPVDSNDTEAGRAKNRRVEVVLGTTS